MWVKACSVLQLNPSKYSLLGVCTQASEHPPTETGAPTHLFMAPNRHQTFKPFQLYWNESPFSQWIHMFCPGTDGHHPSHPMPTPLILQCLHLGVSLTNVTPSRRWWGHCGQGESHRGGAHSKILALYPKGFLVGLAPENMHIPWQCRPTWEDILCSSVSCMLGRRTGQPGFGQAQGRATLESNCAGQLSLTLRMNFNSCLIGDCGRVFPAVAHTQDHYLTKWLWDPLRGHGWWKNMDEFMVTSLLQATLTESDLHRQTHLWLARGETPVLHLPEVEHSRALYLGVIGHSSFSEILLCSSLWKKWKHL